MAISDYVEQILSSPVYVFDGIIEKLIGKNVHFAKIELGRHPICIDAVLIESIKSILKDLEEEEGFISRFLYRKFGFEVRKNKRREQLIYLGSELKTQHFKIKNRLYGLYRQKERLTYSILDLGRLTEGFDTKEMFFESESMKNKSKFYVGEIGLQIDELQSLQLSLLMKHDDLSEIEGIYSKLFQRIPRHQDLHEEAHLLLQNSIKS
ncbi:MAG: Unknown protein [uncultured Sulfurovum sp.]|uniref:Uncharacterized protein n=1 Tax=uncultured Sulfurovum sp. TaxID=269237 RepID=A0A6S6SHU7_9BACT|nr:MAG: Unknown protein [uncultured Sulfurovum sp.]